MPKIVGIDLGTTNSVIAVMEGGEPTVIPTAEGGRLCPSVVGFSKNGERLVGQAGENRAVVLLLRVPADEGFVCAARQERHVPVADEDAAVKIPELVRGGHHGVTGAQLLGLLGEPEVAAAESGQDVLLPVPDDDNGVSPGDK
jgi:hypothetical protein